jgi:hypothetical protein
LLVYALVNTNQYGWSSARTIGELVAAGALLLLFVAVEGRFAAQPLLPLRIFRSRTLSGANGVALLLGLAIFAVFYFLTLYMQQVLGFSPLRTGVAYLPITFGIIVVAAVLSPLISRIGVTWPLASGMLISAVAFLLLAQLPVHGSYWRDILPAFIVLPLGAGMAFLAVTNAAVAGVKQQEAGLASALLNTSQQVGGALGLAILSTIAAARTTSVLAAHPQAGLAPALVEGFQRAFLAGAGFAAAGTVLALLTISRQVGRAAVPAEAPSAARAAAPEAPLAGALGAAAQIAAAVESWEGATSHAHTYGDIELRAGTTQLGYLHGDAVADLLLPANVREEAIARGVAHPHHLLPESDWVNVHLHHPDRIHEVVALLRSAYERAMASPVQRQAV